MTTTTRNEAAKRLLDLWMPDDLDETDSRSSDAFLHSVEDALAAERRATVKRIRTRLIGLLTTLPGAVEKYPAVRAILDEEAAR